MSRETALKMVVDSLHDSDVVVSTTGMLSRELFEHRVAREQGHERDFLTVGSMGHASSIALGIALNKPRRQVCGFYGIHIHALSNFINSTNKCMLLQYKVHILQL
jgi:phosphonopyruvate decarboxylase